MMMDMMMMMMMMMMMVVVMMIMMMMDMMMDMMMMQVDEYSVRYPLNDHNKDVLFPTGFYRCSEEDGMIDDNK